MSKTPTIGTHLREWRQRRRLSQLELALEADISARHLSFLETGRAQPSREMLLHLAETLQVPMRQRNVLLVAAGFAPVFAERPLEDPALAAARHAIDLVLAAQKPYPAFALDRHWRMVASNGALPELYKGVAADLLQPTPNALRLTLHPQGLAPRIVNLAEWRAHMLGRLRHQIELTADPVLIDLLREVSGYPKIAASRGDEATDPRHAIAVPFKLRIGDDVLSFFSTTTLFGTPVDVTLAELAIESFFPADQATAHRIMAIEAAREKPALN